MVRQLNILHLDMDDNLNFRAATINDCSDLAILGDSATRCLSSHLWTKIASAGQSSFEIGRTSILSDTEHYIHYKNWRVAELNRTVVGALNTYRISQSTQARKDLPDVLRPLDELKASQLLTEAERVAKQENDSVLTLMVGSFNTGALRLYEQFGFIEWKRSKFIPFDNSDRDGDWVLMRKDINGT